MSLQVRDIMFEKTAHVSYADEYVTTYVDKVNGIEKEVSVKRTNHGEGVGKVRTLYYLRNKQTAFKTLENVLTIINSNLSKTVK